MEEPFITAPIYPPSILLTGIVVNREGKRFVAEDSYHSRTSQFVMEQPGSEAFLIIDSEHGELTNYGILVPMIDAYDTIAELETALDLPAGSVAGVARRATTSTPRTARTLTSTRPRTSSRSRTRGRGRRSTCGSARRSTPASPSAASGSPSTGRPSARTAP